MATRRGKGQHGERMMQLDRDERDAKIEALRRQVEELIMCLRHQETHGSRDSSYGYTTDGFKDMNPFTSKEDVGGSSMKRFFSYKWQYQDWLARVLWLTSTWRVSWLA